MKLILYFIRESTKLLEDYIADLGKRAKNYNNREKVKHYLLKECTTEEIAVMTSMTLDEIESHTRYWMGEIPHERQIR